MTRVLRFDAGTLQKPRRTSQGYLMVDGWASRTGIQEYRNPDGSRRLELRDDDAVMDMESLNGFLGAPVTDDHPPEMVSVSNSKAYTKGTVVSVGRRDGNHVAVSMIVTDPDLIRKMETGKRQLSTGYFVELDETPGVHPKYGRYDARQVRVGPVNHLAVVERGRAGTAAVRMDSAAVDVRLASDLHAATSMPQSGGHMTLDEALARIKELEAKLDAFEAAPAEKCENCGEPMTEDHKCAPKMDAAEVARLEGERDAAREAVKTAEAAAEKAVADAKAEIEKVRKDADDSVSAKVREALNVLSKAVLVLGKDAKIKLDGKDVELIDAPLRAVKCAVVKHVKGKTIPAEKHDAYVDALFEDAIDAHNPGAKSAAAAKAVVVDNEVRKDAETPALPADPEKAALEANKTRISSAWMASETK